LCAVRSEVPYAHARRLTDRHSQLSSASPTIHVVFAQLGCFCVDFFNTMAELVFVTVFDTHICRKKLTERQTFEKTDDFTS